MALIAGSMASMVLLVANRHPEEAQAEPSAEAAVPFYQLRAEANRLREELDAARGELDLVSGQLERAQQAIQFSTRYRIAADLAGDILDIALSEGLDPELAFRLVKLESNFNERATSPVGAVGLAQVMPATAQYFERGITRERLYDRKTNLRIGFRYLRALIRQHKGNVRTALLVYNRGPVAVKNARELGLDPSNGYDRIVMKGYSGRGTVD